MVRSPVVIVIRPSQQSTSAPQLATRIILSKSRMSRRWAGTGSDRLKPAALRLTVHVTTLTTNHDLISAFACQFIYSHRLGSKIPRFMCEIPFVYFCRVVRKLYHQCHDMLGVLLLRSGFWVSVWVLPLENMIKARHRLQRVDAGHDHDYDDHVGKCYVIPCSKIEARFHDRKRTVLCYAT